MKTIRFFKKQAKKLTRAARTGNREAVKRLGRLVRNEDKVRHSYALHVVAKEAGFESWQDLVASSDEDRQLAIDVIKTQPNEPYIYT